MTGIMKYRSGKKPLGFVILHRLGVVLGAVLLTLTFFLVLPIIQAINEKPEPDQKIYDPSLAELPTPEPPPEEEQPEEEEEEVPEEELQPDDQLLSLSQLELALSGDLGGGWGGSGFGQVKLPSLTGGADGDDAGFALGGMDQEPRARHKQSPTISSAIRARIQSGPATVWLAFIVDTDGRVIRPRVLSSPDPVFNGPALAAIKKWRYDPARSNGRPVQQPMKQPITFRKQQ